MHIMMTLHIMKLLLEWILHYRVICQILEKTEWALILYMQLDLGSGYGLINMMVSLYIE